MKTLIINGHPNPQSLCAELAAKAAEKAKSKGDKVEILHLRNLKFDPNLNVGFKGEQQLESDLQDAQKKILWAEHLIWVYPNWWGSMPALQKGFIDRTFLPDFAFKYVKGAMMPKKLLVGKTAEIIITMDTPPFIYQWLLGAPGLKIMKKGILEFCGIKVVKTKMIGPVRGAKKEQVENWIK